VSSWTMGLEPFETIVDAHHGEIYRYLLRMTARPSDADDLAQETFLRAYRAYRTLTPDANVRAWLFAIATNLARNHFRAERRRRAAHAGLHRAARAVDGAAPDGEALADEARARLDALVAALPLRQRAAFVLRKVHDLDYDTIGRSLGCSAETARAHVFQAVRKLRRGLAGLERPSQEPAP